MNRPFVSICLMAGLFLASFACAQSPDATVRPDSATDVIPAAIPSPDIADSTTAPSPQPAQPLRPNPSIMKGMGRHGRPDLRSNSFPPEQQPQAPPTADPTTIIASPTAIVDMPFNEDSALEIKLKTDPEAARRYRSPRKAFFFSLLLPGAGQAYVGAWGKMAVFAAAEIGLGVGWYQVAVVASRDKAREAQRYAATHWRQQKYEAQWQKVFSKDSSEILRKGTAPWRESYCQALYGDAPDNLRLNACTDAPVATNENYPGHLAQFGTGGLLSTSPDAWSTDSVLGFRQANIKDQDGFHDMIGRYNEFVTGWEDTPDTVSAPGLLNYYSALVDHATDPSKTFPLNPWGVSQMQANYRALRTRSDDLARTQKWFMGAMILNHLISAFDAALQASRMNHQLLHLETTWLDRIELDGGLAVVPQISSHAAVAWRF